MRISFLGQPFTAFGGWTADWLEQRLTDPDIREVRIASAWVKRSGLARTQGAFEAFRRRGGSVSIIVGIDEGGATSQGLRLAYDVFDQVHVFCDPSSRTYHPKVYHLSGESVAYLLVGSNNLTAGGLYSNFEGALACHLDLTTAQDRELSNEALAWFELMYSDTNACKHLTGELLSSLIEDTRYHITDENKGRVARALDDEDYDGIATKSPTQRIFGLSSSPKRGMAPRISRQSGTANNQPVPEPTRTPTVPGQTIAHGIALRWYKKMSASDAQQPLTVNSKRTGNLKLTQADHDIDHRTFFRQEMFGDALWATTVTARGAKEEAVIPFDVIIAGVTYGEFALKIDHADYRVASQGNVPTWLHWGGLSPILQSMNLTYAWVIIERDSDSSYRLEISRKISS